MSPLAAQSSSGQSGIRAAKDPSREAERERRREEARRRAEERRLRREARQKQPLKAQIVSDEAERTLESDDGGPVDLNKSKPEWTSNNPTDIQTATPEDSSDVREKALDEAMEDKGSSSSEQSNSDFDDEIEEQLRGMPSTLANEKQLPEPGEVIEIDWSDVGNVGQNNKSSNEFKKSRGKLQLKPSLPPETTSVQHNGGVNSYSSPLDYHSRNSFQPKQDSFDFNDDWSQDNWGNSTDTATANSFSVDLTVDTLSPKRTSPKESSDKAVSELAKDLTKSKIGKVSHGPPKVSDALGAEFDIKSMDTKNFKMATQEVDFFADMLPNLGTTSKAASNVLDMLTHVNKSDQSTGSKEEKTKPATSFAVQNTDNDQETAGWGDEDFEW